MLRTHTGSVESVLPTNFVSVAKLRCMSSDQHSVQVEICLVVSAVGKGGDGLRIYLDGSSQHDNIV